METVTGKPTAPDNVCIRFCRATESLMEEPEICENCAFWSSGACFCDSEKIRQEGGNP